MAASQAQVAYLCMLEVEDAAGSGVFVELAEIKNVEKPNPTVNQVDVTHMKSPNRTNEKRAGMADPADVTYDLNWIPNSTTDEFIETWRDSGETRSTRMTINPGGATRTFPSHVKSYSGSARVGEAMQAQLALTVDGAVVRG